MNEYHYPSSPRDSTSPRRAAAFSNRDSPARGFDGAATANPAGAAAVLGSFSDEVSHLLHHSALWRSRDLSSLRDEPRSPHSDGNSYNALHKSLSAPVLKTMRRNSAAPRGPQHHLRSTASTPRMTREERDRRESVSLGAAMRMAQLQAQRAVLEAAEKGLAQRLSSCSAKRPAIGGAEYGAGGGGSASMITDGPVTRRSSRSIAVAPAEPRCTIVAHASVAQAGARRETSSACGGARTPVDVQQRAADEERIGTGVVGVTTCRQCGGGVRRCEPAEACTPFEWMMCNRLQALGASLRRL